MADNTLGMVTLPTRLTLSFALVSLTRSSFNALIFTSSSLIAFLEEFYRLLGFTDLVYLGHFDL